MYFKYEEKNEIHVPFPYSRIMTPFMTSDTASGDIPFSIHMAQWEPGAEVDAVLFRMSGTG